MSVKNVVGRSLCVCLKESSVGLAYPSWVSSPPLFFLAVSVRGAARLGFLCLRCSVGCSVPSSVSFSLVLFSCLGLLCSCGAALSGAPLFPLFLALFFFVGVLAWVVVSSLWRSSSAVPACAGPVVVVVLSACALFGGFPVRSLRSVRLGFVMMYSEGTLFVVVVANEFGDVEDRIPCYSWAEVVEHLAQLQVRAEGGYQFTIKTVAL